jgi:hypothetical protein
MRKLHAALATTATMAAACGGAAATAAAAPWSAPATVPQTSGASGLQGPGLSFTTTGRGLVSWPDARVELHRDGTFRTPISVPGLLGAPQTFGAVGVADLRGRTAGGRTTLDAELGTVWGFLGPDRTVARDVRLDAAPMLAGNRSGDLAAVWSQAAGDHDHVELAIRHPGHRFGLPHTLRGSGALTDVVAAVGDRGDRVVAWQRAARDSKGRLHYTIEARLQRPGHHLGSVLRLGSSRGAADLAAAIAPTGRVYLVWSEHDGGEEVNEPPAFWAAIAAPSDFSFGAAPQLLRAPAAAAPQGTPHVAVDAAGDAVAAFSLPVDNVTTMVEVATAAAGAPFGAPFPVAEEGILEDLAVGADGRAVVVWDGAHGATYHPRSVFASLRPALGSPFSAPETVSPAPEDPGDAAAAFDGSGRPVVLWAGRPGYDGGFPPQQPLALRLAVRTG